MIEPPGELSRLTAVLGDAGRAPTDAAKAAVYRQLLEAVLLAPLDPASTDERAVLLVERKENGRLELPAFSCRRAFRLWGAVPTHLAARAPDLFRTALLEGVDRVVLDPSGPVRVTLGSWEVRRLAAGTVPEVHGSPDRDARSACPIRRCPRTSAAPSARPSPSSPPWRPRRSSRPTPYAAAGTSWSACGSRTTSRPSR